MKALKRGHAPKSVLKHEAAEYKSMSYKHGGNVETGRTGYGMKDDEKGGRKAPNPGGTAAPVSVNLVCQEAMS